MWPLRPQMRYFGSEASRIHVYSAAIIQHAPANGVLGTLSVTCLPDLIHVTYLHISSQLDTTLEVYHDLRMGGCDQL